MGCGSAKSGDATISESNQAIYSSVCWADLKSTYNTTYFPIMSTKCINCHGAGHGSSDIDISMSAFLEKGTSLINTQATRNHGGNSLNVEEISAEINLFQVEWGSSESEYNKCLVREGLSTTGAGDNVVRINSKDITSRLKYDKNIGVWSLITWDLDTEVPDSMKNQVHAYFTAEVKYYNLVTSSGTGTYGILISNPSITLKSTQSTLRVKNMHIFIGDTESSNTTYAYIDKTAASAAITNLAPKSAAALVVYDDDDNPDSVEPPVISLGFKFSTD
jgi:hypothetical protein